MKQSELLRKQADMMDMAEKHGISWHMLFKIKIRGEYLFTSDDFLYENQKYQFALGVVEGKPVFAGDTLYCKTPTLKNTFTPVKFDNGTECFVDCSSFCISPEGLSWNPPKPKTVMIELPINMATYYAELKNQDISVMREACRKALESIKQS